jgi:ribosomal protein S18 acetylase RimI-like enzyme
MKEDILIRDANLKDIDFLVETVINAEKGHRHIIPYCALFDISEVELRSVLKKIFMEDVPDFDFSAGNFMIAEHDGYPVAAYAGWIEGVGGIPSRILKMSAFKTFMPKNHIAHYESVAHIDGEILLKRDHLTLQLEMTYVKKDYRRMGIVALLTNALFKKAKRTNPEITRAQVQLFKENTAAFLSQSKLGFVIVEEKKSGNPEMLNYMPGMTKIKMEKLIT